MIVNYTEYFLSRKQKMVIISASLTGTGGH